MIFAVRLSPFLDGNDGFGRTGRDILNLERRRFQARGSIANREVGGSGGFLSVGAFVELITRQHNSTEPSWVLVPWQP